MYTLADVQALMPYFCTTDYGVPVEPCDGISVEFFDAGHLLGSASIRITVTENGKPHRIVFSGTSAHPIAPFSAIPACRMQPTR